MPRPPMPLKDTNRMRHPPCGHAHMALDMQPGQPGRADWCLSLTDELGNTTHHCLPITDLCGDVLGDWLAAVAALLQGCTAVELQWYEHHHTHAWRLERSRNQEDPPAPVMWINITLTRLNGHPDDPPDPNHTPTKWTGRCLPGALARAVLDCTERTLHACGGWQGYNDAWFGGEQLGLQMAVVAALTRQHG